VTGLTAIMTAYMSWRKDKPGRRDAPLGYRRSSFSEARANHPRIAIEFLASPYRVFSLRAVQSSRSAARDHWIADLILARGALSPSREATSSPLSRVQVRDGPALFMGFAVAWVYLVIAGFLEVAWAYAMKQSDGFTRPWPTIITISAMVGSVGLLALAMRAIPLSTAYPIWTGIGAVGAFLIGVTILGEQATAARIMAATLIIAGLVTMKVSSSSILLKNSDFRLDHNCRDRAAVTRNFC
jgi:quaternary ammonium compound-resistance protein SugE